MSRARSDGVGGSAEQRQRLTEGASALGVALDDRVQDRLLEYLAMLHRWGNVYNLTALREPSAMLSHHLLDCLAVIAPLRTRTAGCGAPLRVLDVGSGGGLPGVVLAIAERDWQVTCVDAVAKKAAFVRQVAAELGLSNLASVHRRVEAMSCDQRYDVVVSRAFASLADFLTLTEPLLADCGVWMAMKGRPDSAELTALPRDTEVFHVEQLTVPLLAEQRCLVWIRKNGSTKRSSSP